MLIDTHAHLNFQAFKDDFEEVLKRAQEDGIEKIINVGADLDSSQKAVEIAQKYDNCYASVGIHPHHAENYDQTITEKLEKLAQNPKVVAIGECGLDYHSYENGGITDPKKQKELFWAQIELAQKLNLPAIFHCRSTFAEATVDKDAHDDILGILRAESCKLNGVFHCFSGDQNFLETVLKMGFYVGFDGNITYKPRVSMRFSSEASPASKNSHHLRESVKMTPMERLLLETDCPFLSPEPYRGLRNEPKNVKIIAHAVAEIKALPLAQIEKETTQNAQNLFKF